MRENETELLLKIQETEQVLLELKKELEKEKEKTQNLKPLFLEKFDQVVTLHTIVELFAAKNIHVDFFIRSGGEFAYKGIYLGHHKPEWEIVKDSLDAFVLVPKDLLPEENLLTK
jgi:hypothetical protein